MPAIQVILKELIPLIMSEAMAQVCLDEPMLGHLENINFFLIEFILLKVEEIEQQFTATNYIGYRDQPQKFKKVIEFFAKNLGLQNIEKRDLLVLEEILKLPLEKAVGCLENKMFINALMNPGIHPSQIRNMQGFLPHPVIMDKVFAKDVKRELMNGFFHNMGYLKPFFDHYPRVLRVYRPLEAGATPSVAILESSCTNSGYDNVNLEWNRSQTAELLCQDPNAVLGGITEWVIGLSQNEESTMPIASRGPFLDVCFEIADDVLPGLLSTIMNSQLNSQGVFPRALYTLIIGYYLWRPQAVAVMPAELLSEDSATALIPPAGAAAAAAPALALIPAAAVCDVKINPVRQLNYRYLYHHFFCPAPTEFNNPSQHIFIEMFRIIAVASGSSNGNIDNEIRHMASIIEPIGWLSGNPQSVGIREYFSSKIKEKYEGSNQGYSAKVIVLVAICNQFLSDGNIKVLRNELRQLKAFFATEEFACFSKGIRCHIEIRRIQESFNTLPGVGTREDAYYMPITVAADAKSIQPQL